MLAPFCNRGAGAIGGDLLPHHIGLETVAPTPTMRPGGGVMVLPRVRVVHDWDYQRPLHVTSPLCLRLDNVPDFRRCSFTSSFRH